MTSTKYYNTIAKEYDNHYNNGPFWNIYNEVTWHYLKNYLPKDKENSLILDAGGGTGIWSIRIAKEGYNVILTDISNGMLDIARQKIKNENLESKINIINADITNLNAFKNENFELSLAEGDPVSYCSNPQKAIAELSRVTKANGHITVSVDNKLHWASKFIKLGEIEKADEVLEKEISHMQTGVGNETYPAHMFTIEKLSDLFMQNKIEPVKSVGKPVFITPSDDLEDETVFNNSLALEIKYSSLPSVVGAGGHIALIGKKIK
ncbi:MAG: methyltransferase domain-containing protein [bacterium]|nr:methyltransferase domain-containing protein [bacterium]